MVKKLLKEFLLAQLFATKGFNEIFQLGTFFQCFKLWLTASRRLLAIKTGLLPEVIAVELLINQIVQRMTLNQEMQLRVCEIKLFSWLKYQVHER